MKGTGPWIWGGLLGLIGLLSLYISSHADSDFFYYGGLIAFGTCTGAIFYLIDKAFVKHAADSNKETSHDSS